MPAILLTRPTAVARQFAERLRARLGEVEIVISPLLEIIWIEAFPEGATGTPIFTSRNGVEGFLKAGGVASGPCWCVGDATAQAARAAGFAAHSASGTAQTLIAAILESDESGPFLHLRGAHARADVAKTLAAAGRPAQEVVVYDQKVRDLTAEARELLKSEKPVVLPLFSPRTAAQFAQVYSGTVPLFTAVMSDAVRHEIARLEPVRLALAESPDAAAMLDATERLFDAALCLERGQSAK